ncbi:hypothetical protein [Shinella zoogloeoides]|uniref:hypothetical protein n=1 Tax=Shinella zoogloeoides TaxID=352475 RepID=UPI00273E9D4E|nr:hypothetical protein [Shinella zoogloeoides]WLR90943.1 hypothetical protein Q9316_00775 [Shinella zoogloeoides]
MSPRITDEMVAVINRDYLIKGIGAREAVRRILKLAEEQPGPEFDDSYRPAGTAIEGRTP